MNRHVRFSKWHFVTICLICSFIFSPGILKVASTYNANEGSTSIQQAYDTISSAFEAVLKAESAGANVTNLIIKLDEAAGCLSDANVLLMNGGSGDIDELTERSVEIAGEVKNEAQVLQANTLSNRDYIFKISVIESLVGVPAFLLCMILFWRWFKSYYTHKIMSLKPEVAENVEG